MGVPTTQRALRSELMQMALGYWHAQILFSCLELGVFEALSEREDDAAGVAATAGADPERTALLLAAAAQLGLLEREGERFRNSEMASSFLVAGDGSMTDWIRFIAGCYEPWGQLAESVRDGKPVRDRTDDFLGPDESLRNLILAMRDYARGAGSVMPRSLDLSGRRRLLDLGGGPGTHSLNLARRFPDLTCVVFDLPAVVSITDQLIEEEGLGDRVTTVPGDYLTDDIGTGYDVVLLSNMLHQEDPDGCMAILRKARAALSPGGLLVIQLAFLEPDRSGPMWALLQSLQLGLFYEGGRAYTQAEILDMIEPAGFANGRTQRLSLINPESLILADRPE